LTQARRPKKGQVDSFVPQDTGSISAITSRLDPRQGEPMSIVNDLEKATDLPRRGFKRVKNNMDTRIQVEKIIDEGRELN
jgi:hypothetical protein